MNPHVNPESPRGLAETLVTEARDLLLKAMTIHESGCNTPGCLVKANILAYLAHCIGANQEDLKAIPKFLVDYDLKCVNCPHTKGGA